MSETQHTRGPWWIDECSDSDTTAISAAGMDGLCIIQHDEDRPYFDPQQQANARLIAAAPELLEALQKCQSAIAMLIEPGSIRITDVASAYSTCMSAAAVAQSAVAKALST